MLFMFRSVFEALVRVMSPMNGEPFGIVPVWSRTRIGKG
jgi:hypothetical protein